MLFLLQLFQSFVHFCNYAGKPVKVFSEVPFDMPELFAFGILDVVPFMEFARLLARSVDFFSEALQLSLQIVYLGRDSVFMFIA